MITAWILSIIGLIVCFSGYRIFKKIIALWGFLLGGTLGALLAGYLIADVSIIQKAIGFFIGAIVGAGLAFPLYRLVVFITGSILGLTIANIFANLAFPGDTGAKLLITLVLVFVTGGMALTLQKFTIILSTAFFGAALMLSGPLQANGLAASGIGIWQSFSASQPLGGALPAEWYIAWFIAGLVGMIIQIQQNKQES